MNANPTLVADSAVPRKVTFHSGEHLLHGTLFTTAGPPRAIAVINGATAVPAGFYAPFADWLATQGIATLTYDYRDFAASAKDHPRHSSATMADWAVHDAQAARDFAAQQFPGTPLWVIGHSLGALCLPFQKRLDRIARVIAVCSGPVHTSDHPWPYQARARAFWNGPVPLAVRLAGYLPGKRLGFGPDLPAGVYWQWRRWCTTRGFHAGDIGTGLPYPDWTGLTAPMKFVTASDDALVPPAAVWRLMQCYPEAMKTQLTLRPSDYGLTSIGHIAAFSAKSQAAWKDIIA